MPDITRWNFRLLLAMLLLFGMEILLWNKPPSRSLTDWLIVFVGYLALSTLMLDLIVRFRVSDIWGVMFVVGIYVLLNGLVINPSNAMEAVPGTIITRFLGGGWLVGLEISITRIPNLPKAT